MEVNGWKDIGYHFGVELVGPAYQVMLGRDLSTPGAHCKESSMNQLAIGVCCVGNFDLAPPSSTQLDCLRALVRSLMQDRLRQTVTHIAAGLGVDAEVEIRKGYPVLFNDLAVTEKAENICREYLGAENVHESEPIMTAEDFAYYLQECPGTFWQIGTGTLQHDKSNTLHSPTFNPEERALEIGSGLLAYSALRLLQTA